MTLRTTLSVVFTSALFAAAGAGAGYLASGISPVMAAGAAIGLMAGLAITLAIGLRGRSLRKLEDVSRHTRIEAVTAIERFQPGTDSSLPVPEFPGALNAYEQLATWVVSRREDGIRALVVTSARAEEGKSTTAANLATTLARQGYKVLLVDADLRCSSLRSAGADANSVGLAGLLLDYTRAPHGATIRTEDPNLLLLPAGALPPRPQELLALPRLADIMASLRRMADYVILDSPSVLEAGDTGLLAQHADAALMVIRAGRTRSRTVNRAARLLSRSGVGRIGAVLNVTRPAPAVAAPERSDAVARAEIRVFAGARGTAGLQSEAAAEWALPMLAAEAAGTDADLKPGDVFVPPSAPLRPAPASRMPAQPSRVPDVGVLSSFLRLVHETHEIPGPMHTASRLNPGEYSTPGAKADTSIDAVLSHMQESLRMLRELRESETATHSR